MEQRSARFRRWRWTVFWTLLLGYVAYYLCRANLSAASELVMETLQIDRESFGLISAVSTWAYAVGKFTHGFLADRFGGRVMFLLGIFGAAVFSGACGLFGSLGALVGLWSLNRFLQAGGWVGMVQVSAQWYRRTEVGTAMSMISLSYLVGDIAGRGLAATIVKEGGGLSAVFLVPAAITLVVAMVSVYTLKPSPESVGEPALNAEEAGEARDEGGFRKEDLKRLLKSPGFIMLCVMSILLTAIRLAFQDWSAAYFKHLGVDLAGSMWDSAIFPTAGAVATLLAGVVSDRMHAGQRAPICITLLLVLTGGLICFATMDDITPADARILMAICGFGLLGPYSLLGGAGSIDVGGRRTAAVAAGLVDGIGYLLGPLFGSLGVASLIQRLGWNAAFVALACASLVSVVAAYFFLRATRPKPTTAASV